MFHLSYLGHDPRDGSVREPSVLVSELVDVAAQSHRDADAARRDLVVHHPLQPFSPAAFGGDGEPRRFSYRGQWHPAAGASAVARTRLAPWAGTALPEPADDDSVLSLDALKRFFTRPAGEFLRQRLDLRLPDGLDAQDDIEPLLVPRRGLDAVHLQQAVIEALLRGDEAQLHARLRARALLPSGALGERQFEGLLQSLCGYVDAYRGWCGASEATSVLHEVEVDGVRIVGRIDEVHAHGIGRLRPGKQSASAVIRDGLDRLLAAAAGDPRPLVGVHDVEGFGIGPHISPLLDVDTARDALRTLLQLRRAGLRAPLLYGPRTGWALWNAPNPDRARRLAYDAWHGSDHAWGEATADAMQLALRGLDPFASDADFDALADNCGRVFAAVCAGMATASAAEDADA